MNAVEHQSLERLRRLEKTLAPVGWILAAGAAVVLYLQMPSIWLALFGFMMVSRFMIGSLPKIIHHPRKLYRTLFYLLWPVGGTAILYFAYRAWEMMWLAVILGILGGMIFSVLVGYYFFQDVATEDQAREKGVSQFLVEETFEKHPDAVAMKERFTASEWEEIKQFPWMVFGTVALAKGQVSKKVLNVWAEAVVDPKDYEDPLLRMMLLEFGANITRSMGQTNSLSQLSMMFSMNEYESLAQRGELKMQMEGIFNVKPEAMHTIEANLNPEEFRSFINGLVQLGMRAGTADGGPTGAQMNALLTFVPAESKEDLLAMLGVERA